MKNSYLTRYIFLAFLSLMFTLTSCSEHEDAWYGNATVGSILLSDNTVISAERYDSTKMTAIGVVIGTCMDSTWVVSVNELGRKQYLDTLMTVDNVSTDLTALDGRENTAGLLQSERTSEAANSVVNFSSPIGGWSLPSAGELLMIKANLPTIEHSMSIVGGDAFSTSPYLSSTQDGSSDETEELYVCCVTLQTGYVSSMLKTGRALVRPVLRLRTP